MKATTIWKSWQAPALLAILLLAFVLRVYQLGAQSLWYDESDRVFVASLPLGQLFHTMAEEGLEGLPLYYLVIKPFVVPFHELAARFPSASLGVLAVALIAQVARVLWGQRAVVPAALLLAVNPFHLWFSRDATFYSMVALSAAGTLYYFILLLREPRGSFWVGLTVFSSLGLCTHYFAFAMPLVCFLYLLLTWRQNWTLLRPWALSQIVAVAPLTPWYVFVIQRGQYYFAGAPAKSPQLVELLYTLRNFSIGDTGSITWEVPVAVAICGAMVLLATVWMVRTHQSYWGLLLLWLLLPIALTFLMSLRLPMYVDRYLMPTLPVFILLVVGGLEALPQRGCASTLVVLLTVSIVGVVRIYTDPAYTKEDWRGVAQYIEQHEQPGDVGIPLLYQSLEPLYGHYYRGQVPLKPVQVGQAVRDPAKTVEGYKRAWLIVPHPHYSAHLLAQCQPFDVFDVSTYGAPPPPEYLKWLEANRARVIKVRPFACIEVLLFDLQAPGQKP